MADMKGKTREEIIAADGRRAGFRFVLKQADERETVLLEPCAHGRLLARKALVIARGMAEVDDERSAWIERASHGE